MSNQWFRLYNEIITDPKLLCVTETLRWRYVAMLCLHNAGQLDRPEDEVAVALRLTPEELQETRAALIKRGLLTADGLPAAWEKRQYISDKADPTAAERNARYRERKRNDRNAGVTLRAPETDTDTETDTEELDKSNSSASDGTKPPAEPEGFAEFYENAYPRKTGRKAALKAFKTALKETDHAAIIAGAKRYAEQCHANRTEQQFIKQPATWLNAGCWADEPVNHSTTYRGADRKPNDGDTLLRAAATAAHALRA